MPDEVGGMRLAAPLAMSSLVVWALFSDPGPIRAETNSGKAGALKAKIGVDAYRLAAGPIRIKGVRMNASGLTFSPATKSLFMAIDWPAQLVELSTSGEVARTIELEGFVDPEGVVHLGKDRFAVAEEGRMTITSFGIGPRAGKVDRRTAVKLSLPVSTRIGNTGLEGLAYDPIGKRFLAVKEMLPKGLYWVALPAGSTGARALSPKVDQSWDIGKNSLGMRDLSGVHYDPKTRHLLLLSHESCCIVEATVDGKPVGRLALTAGSAGLAKAVPKAEGVTMDDQGALYICSEPNLLYVFKKREPAKP